jgi:hypothetical protein
MRRLVEVRQREMVIAAYQDVPPFSVLVLPHEPPWEWCQVRAPFAELRGYDTIVQRPYTPARIWLSDEQECRGIVEERWVWMCRVSDRWEPFGLPDCWPMQRDAWRCLLEVR